MAQASSNFIFDTKFIKFLIVGGMNTLIGYMIFSLFLFLNFHYTLASFLALIIGIIFNFKTYSRLVFENQDNRLIFRYIISWTILYLITITCLTGFEWFGINLYLANAMLILPISILAFFINLKFVFIDQNNGHQA